MKRFLALVFTAVGSAVLASLAVLWIVGHKNEDSTHRTDAVEFIREVLKLGVVEVHLSQIFEVKKENLTVSDIPIPFTGQKSVIVVKGTALAGYNLDQVI